jgi:hypothetical protein
MLNKVEQAALLASKMNTGVFAVALPPLCIAALRCAVMLVLGVGFLHAAEPAKKSVAPSQGYLSKDPPPGLRFAAPPRPPVASLPPAAIPANTAPVFSEKFYDKEEFRPEDPSKLKAPDKLPKTVKKVSNEKPAEKPAAVQSNPDALKLLVKYFEFGTSIPSSSDGTNRFKPPLKEEPEAAAPSTVPKGH